MGLFSREKHEDVDRYYDALERVDNARSNAEADDARADLREAEQHVNRSRRHSR